MSTNSETGPVPARIRLHRKSGTLDLEYADQQFCLDAEYLRVHSPSAEVRGHGSGQEILQTGKRGVGIESVEAVGNYALKLVFSDGHDSGIYSWAYLHELGSMQEQYWARYLNRLEAAGESR